MLNLGKLTPTTLSSHMTNKSLTNPKGIIEVVLAKKDDFFFLINFLVLDMEEDNNAPLILRPQFLATRQVLLDVKNKELTLKVGIE